MANKPIIPAEIQGKLEKKLAREGFIPDGYVEQEITNQTNVPCPLCDAHVEVTCKGNSHRVDCKEHGTIISARGV